MTFASDKGADAFGICHGGLVGNPAGGRREKAPGAVILSNYRIQCNHMK